MNTTMIIYNDERDYPEHYYGYDDTYMDNPHDCDDRYNANKNDEFMND